MRTITSSRDEYINSVFGQEDQHLQNIRERLRKDGKEGINVGPYEGRILQYLVKSVAAKNVVEVGLLYGYSTLWMARGLAEGGIIHSLEIDSENHKAAQELLSQTEVFQSIRLHLGEAKSTLAELEPHGPFDVVFIDADKAAYPDYLTWAEKNLRQGGLVIGDNTFLFGHLTGEKPSDPNTANKRVENMRSFNERIANNKKFNSMLLPTNEGLTVGQLL